MSRHPYGGVAGRRDRGGRNVRMPRMLHWANSAGSAGIRPVTVKPLAMGTGETLHPPLQFVAGRTADSH